MKNFKIVNNEIEFTLAERIFEGRLTVKRYHIIKNYVKRFNHISKNPYGVSKFGYSYNCGCEHDCCGCLHKQYIEMLYQNNKLILQLFAHYNY